VDEDLKKTGGEACDLLLVSVDVDRLDEDLLVGLLTSTYAGRRLIPARAAFSKRALARLERDIGADAARKLIAEIT